MEKYLYGSSVQHIQSFIFETGKLKEIIGASEFVEQICTSMFKDKVGNSYRDDHLIVGAAGKITYLFDDRESCERVVFDFHKSILEEIPSIRLSQAVVKIENEQFSGEHLDVLEQKLNIQRNKHNHRHGLGWMISERSRRTGGVGCEKKMEGELYVVLDRIQSKKNKYDKGERDKLFSKILGEDHKYSNKVFALEPEQMLGNNENSWVAIIHADGNNLGRTIRAITKKIETRGSDSANIDQMIQTFSRKLDEATRKAATEAFEKIVKPVYDKEVAQNTAAKLPLRPVLLGGDDLTIIIRGELAIPFTNEYLKRFESHTKANFKQLVDTFNLLELKDGLTACAGIAFIKPKYPFHYGVDLSDDLCKYAKKKAKEVDYTLTPSCLAYHRVQSSFVGNYDSIIKKELLANEIKLTNMPYYVNNLENKITIDTLLDWVEKIQKEEAPKAPIREWLTVLADDTETAKLMMDRIKALNPNFVKPLKLDKAINELTKSTHLQDVISLSSIGKTE